MKKMTSLCIFAGILAVSWVCSVATQAKDPCDDPQTQTQINACAVEAYSKADAELNKIYGKVMAMLNAERKVKLKEVQLAWIKFRDAHCRFINAEAAGGTMYPVLQYGCLSSLTETRSAQLTAILESAR